MKRFTEYLASKFISDHKEISNPSVRACYGLMEGWISIIVNCLLFAVKIAIGLSTKSISLIADAVHTLSDSITSAVIIMGFKLSCKPSDKEHPFGHGRMESVATLVVSVLLFIAGIELFKRSVHSMVHPTSSPASILAITVIVLTIVIKELIARFSFHLGDMIDSSALKADALHHRTDVFATGLVVIAMIATRWGYPNIDGIMGIGVSFIIFYSVFEIAKEAVDPLLGEAPSYDSIRKIESTAKKHEGVLGVHDIIYHKYGQVSIISLHIEVSSSGNIMDLHNIAEHIEEEIGTTMGGHVVVHIDPLNTDHPQYRIISETISGIIDKDPRVHSFHDLRIVGQETDNCNVVFDIVLNENIGENESYSITKSIRKKFKNIFPGMKVVIKAEPKYMYNL